MENIQALQNGNIIEFCYQLLYMCETYIINQRAPVKYYATYLCHLLPDLLSCVFGSLTTRYHTKTLFLISASSSKNRFYRGWVQTQMHHQQAEAIKKLLLVNGHFYNALVILSLYSDEFSYDIYFNTLPVSI